MTTIKWTGKTIERKAIVESDEIVNLQERKDIAELLLSDTHQISGYVVPDGDIIEWNFEPVEYDKETGKLLRCRVIKTRHTPIQKTLG